LDALLFFWGGGVPTQLVGQCPRNTFLLNGHARLSLHQTVPVLPSGTRLICELVAQDPCHGILSVCLATCPSICLLVRPSARLPVPLPFGLRPCARRGQTTRLSTSQRARPSVRPSVGLSVARGAGDRRPWQALGVLAPGQAALHPALHGLPVLQRPQLERRPRRVHGAARLPAAGSCKACLASCLSLWPCAARVPCVPASPESV
jgi:hypothetical protein